MSNNYVTMRSIQIVKDFYKMIQIQYLFTQVREHRLWYIYQDFVRIKHKRFCDL